MIAMGLDVGHQGIKVVVMNGDVLLGASWKEIGGSVAEGVEMASREALAQGGIKEGELIAAVATGVGKEEVPLARERASEILCHLVGARLMVAGARTVVDLGAEGSRVAVCDEMGRLSDFVMNDRCAAGTGTFLDTVAKMTGIEVVELGEMASRAASAAEISGMCAVFAESEVVSEVHRGTPREAIVRGCCEAVAMKNVALMRRVSLVPIIVVTGGVAQNRWIVEAMGREMGVELAVPDRAHIAGAIGAALLAQRRREERV